MRVKPVEQLTPYEAVLRSFGYGYRYRRSAEEHQTVLNPLNSPTLAGLGAFTAYSGDWERGRALVERAIDLNPRHSGWYWLPLIYEAYRRGDYRGAGGDAPVEAGLSRHWSRETRNVVR